MKREEITIRVSPNMAKSYREADEQQRMKLGFLIELFFERAQRDTRTLQEVIRDISSEAQARGLTEEILAEILAEPPTDRLPNWYNVYEGMTDEGIDDIESMIVRDSGSRTGESRDCR